MNECFGRKFVLNGSLMPAELFDNSMVYEGDSVYEVIRIVKGNPVFFSDHMDRLEASARIGNKSLLADRQMLIKDFMNLSKTEKKKEINLKIVFNYNKGIENYLLYFIEPVYPSEEQYIKGVKGILFRAERKEPETKVINHKLRSSIFHRLILEGGYEALLVNENGCITEGSRSNIFFLKGETLTTAPDETVLNGITRKYILEICRELKKAVVFRCIPADSISEFDAVFMTGTSPMVLPFCCIGDVYFQTDIPLIGKLRMSYLEKTEESIRRFISGA